MCMLGIGYLFIGFQLLMRHSFSCDCLISDRLSMVSIIDTPYEAISRKVRRTYQQRC